jgi:hypothetical protein
LQLLRFLGDTAAVNRHEAVLQFITNRKNVTRAEIETYYRNNIGKLVSQVVDEAERDAQASGRVTLPNNTIPEIKRLFTNFYLSPNQADYDSIINFTVNRKASDEKEIQRISQMNIPGDVGGFGKIAKELEVRLVTTKIDIILLKTRINLGFYEKSAARECLTPESPEYLARRIPHTEARRSQRTRGNIPFEFSVVSVQANRRFAPCLCERFYPPNKPKLPYW